MSRTKVDGTSGTTEVVKRHRRFSGLYLAPVPGLLVSWLIWGWTYGIHWGPVQLGGNPVVRSILLVAFGALTLWLGRHAWEITEHRKDSLRQTFAGSVLLVGALFSVNVGVGPDWYLAGFFVLACWAAAAAWSLSRTDVARNDKREDGEHEAGGKEGLLARWGISLKTRFQAKVIHDEKTGEPIRIEVKAKHADGETADAMMEALPKLESTFGGPAGMSTVSADPDHADVSTTNIELGNPFKGHRPLGPLTNPGKSVAEYSSIADYLTGGPLMATVVGGIRTPNSTSKGYVGMTRTGKTVAENQDLTEMGSRCDWVCLYLNEAKGLQDVRPVIPVVEAAVIVDSDPTTGQATETGLGQYVVAYEMARRIGSYRQAQLALFGLSSWSPRCGSPDVTRRPTRVDPATGRRVVMEQMPWLTVHTGEADSILQNGKAADLAVWLASKGLSTGVNSQWSLQQPDWRAMPTNLRGNIGQWFHFGVKDEGAAEFVIDADMRRSGMRPDKWGQKKPGQFYAIGVGIQDEEKEATALKVRFLVGDDKHPDGSEVDFDELRTRYQDELLRRNLESAKTQAKLDRGSALATGGWWDEQVAKTNEMRARLLGTPQTRSPHDPATESAENPATESANDPAVRTAPTPQSPPAAESAPRKRWTPQTEDDDADGPSAEEMEETMSDYAEEARMATEVAGVELYPADDPDAEDIRNADLNERLRPDPTALFDPLADSEEEGKPMVRDRDESIAALKDTLIEMLDDPALADRKEPGTIVTGPGEVFERCRIHSRPWVSGIMTQLMMGDAVAGLTEDVLMEREGKPGRGRYRLRRVGRPASS